MLQRLSNMDLPEPDDNYNDLELPVNTPKVPDPTQDLDLEHEMDKPDSKSDETIIYDTAEFNSVQQSIDTEPQPKKGILTITEIGIKSNPGIPTDSTPVGHITNQGKLRCNFCKQSFNTRSEKQQHVSRRHADQVSKSKDSGKDVTKQLPLNQIGQHLQQFKKETKTF